MCLLEQLTPAPRANLGVIPGFVFWNRRNSSSSIWVGILITHRTPASPPQAETSPTRTDKITTQLSVPVAAMRTHEPLHEMDPRALLVKRPIANYGPRLNWANWAFTISSAGFLGLRVYCKLTRARTLWWDDHFLIGSWVSNTQAADSRSSRMGLLILTPIITSKLAVLIASAMLTQAVKYGLGHHWDEMPNYDTMPALNKLSYAAGFCTTVATAWSKTSFAITLLRLSSNSWIRWLVWFIIITVNLVLGFQAAMMFIQCWPVAKLWTPSMTGTCWPLHVVQNYTTFASGRYPP